MTNNKQTIVEYGDDFSTLNQDYFYHYYSDVLSLIEVIATCHLNNQPYPVWVRKVMGEAMLDLYQEVFPGAQIEESEDGKRIVNFIDDAGFKAARKRYIPARERALKNLKLNQSKTNAVNVHHKAVRDRAVVDLIIRYSTYTIGEQADFEEAYSVIRQLSDAFSTDLEALQSLYESDGFLSGEINGQKLKARDVPPQCLNMTKEAMEHVWKLFKDTEIADMQPVE